MDRSWPSVDGWAKYAYDLATRKAMAATMALVNECGMHVGVFAINIYKTTILKYHDIFIPNISTFNMIYV